MKGVMGDDGRRISHALKVLDYASALCGAEFPGDPDLRRVVELAAVLHDIGIKEAEARYNSAAPVYQHREGPPIAGRILEEAGAGKEVTARVCHIIGNHHHRSRIDGNDFLLLWEADLLANLPDLPIIKSDYRQYEKMVLSNFKTTTGVRLALSLHPKRQAP